MNYVPQLDALRGLAIIAVLVGHWSPTGTVLRKLSDSAALGAHGVQLFFVMSAFLITAILLQKKEVSVASSRVELCKQFFRFSGRRALRIFPVYYGTLFVVTAVLPFYPEVRNLWPIHASYLTGWYMAIIDGSAPYCSHFWTLGVEEQYYLTWPLVLLFCDLRTAYTVNTWLIVFSLIFCALIVPYVGSSYLSLTLPAHLGSLGIGAWLAMYWHREHQFSEQKCGPIWMRFALPIALSLRVATTFFPVDGRIGLVVSGIGGLLFSVGFASIISNAVVGRSSPILNSGWLQTIGMVSYCVYVIHPFVPRFCNWIFDELEFQVQPIAAIGFWIGITFVCAAASWFLVEKPIIRLKRFV